MVRYVEGVDDPLVNNIRTLLCEGLASDPARLSEGSLSTLLLMCQEVGGTYHDRLRAPVFCAAVAVLWLAVHEEKFPLLADNLRCAAGIAGKQRWAGLDFAQ